MTKENQISTIVAACVLLSGLLVATFYINAYFSKEEEPACGEAASSIFQMNVKAPTGRLMTPIGLQTELGMNALGVIDHTRVVNTGNRSPKVAIEVSLNKGSTSPYLAKGAMSGVAFQWEPSQLRSANTVCLRYAVKLPKEFKPGNGGVLPGLFGGRLMPISENSNGSDGFAIHTLWRMDGRLELHAQIPTTQASNMAMLKREKFDFSKGRWVWLDQEIKLNTPGQNDGAYKLWIDSKIAYENHAMAWRSDDKFSINGVSGAIYYGTPGRESTAPEDIVIGVSPFQLSWN